MKKFIRIFSILILLVCFTGCGLFRYTLKDFMLNMDEGHLEITEYGTVQQSRRAYSDPVDFEYDHNVLMTCDFINEKGYYDIYWESPNGYKPFKIGFVHIPEDIEIHNREKNIYNLTYDEIYFTGLISDIYTYHGHDTKYNCIDALNYVLDGNDYLTFVLKYYDYCDEHDWYYDRENYCPMCGEYGQFKQK